MGALEGLARELTHACAIPATGEIWRARATQATAEIVEFRRADALVVYRRREPGFPHAGQPWCTPLVLFLDAFAPPDGHGDLKPENVIPAAAADLAPAAEVPQDASNRRNEAAAKSSAPAARMVLYVAHPLGAPDRAGLDDNLRRAMRWLSWLRRSFPETTFVAPWIAAVLSGEDDADPAQREAGLVDADAVVARCDGIVLCGGRVSSGMAREREGAARVWCLTWMHDAARDSVAPSLPWEEWSKRYDGDACDCRDCTIANHGEALAALGRSSGGPGIDLSACHDNGKSRSSGTVDDAANAMACELEPGLAVNWKSTRIGAEILRRFDVAEAPKPCCRRIGDGWCYLDAGHDGMCITATQRPLPANDFGPRRARQ